MMCVYDGVVNGFQGLLFHFLVLLYYFVSLNSPRVKMIHIRMLLYYAHVMFRVDKTVPQILSGVTPFTMASRISDVALIMISQT